jgi:hypothetical protein
VGPDLPHHRGRVSVRGNDTVAVGHLFVDVDRLTETAASRGRVGRGSTSLDRLKLVGHDRSLPVVGAVLM